MNDFIYTTKCECPASEKERIIVDHDENFNDLSTVYYHCQNCDIDEWIIDYYTSEILYEHGA